MEWYSSQITISELKVIYNSYWKLYYILLYVFTTLFRLIHFYYLTIVPSFEILATLPNTFEIRWWLLIFSFFWLFIAASIILPNCINFYMIWNFKLLYELKHIHPDFKPSGNLKICYPFHHVSFAASYILLTELTIFTNKNFLNF